MLTLIIGGNKVLLGSQLEAPTFSPILCKVSLSASATLERSRMQPLLEVLEDVRLGRRPPWPCHPDPRKFRPPEPPARLGEITGFGSNPGNLRMLKFLPRTLRKKPPLVVALHGCGQSARAFTRGTGWAKLARELGFALLAPEQRRANNPQRGFNWFSPMDNARDAGECLSIRQMIGWMIEERGIDSKRVYITGLSAGGAMSSVMLTAYPEMFAGGAIIAGLPAGGASNLVEAIALMKGKLDRTSELWGDKARAASSHFGPWPKVSIWHGGADRIVAVSNAEAIARQWRNLHALREEDAIESEVGGRTRRFWRDASGRTALECFILPEMGHAVPIDVSGKTGHAYGVRAPFFEDAGISSTFQIAKFWGLSSRRIF